MMARDCGCGARRSEGKPRFERAAGGLALALGLLAALIPKCPLCLAAQLSLFGIGLGAAAAGAPLLRAISGAVALFTLGWLLARRFAGARAARPRNASTQNATRCTAMQ